MKTLIAAFVLASTAFALTASANARPEDKQRPTTESYYFERASQNHDNGGN